jgi:5-methylcytosine-specific restriction endonuclease McrA
MKIELKEITVRELTDGYEDRQENGVVGYGGRLDIRPPFQREFVYGDKERNAVIDTLTKGFPLNVMYWAVREEGSYEVIDGQQRIISICQYVNGDFSYQQRYFHNLQIDEREQILGYKLMVYFCTGTDREKLDWFETINIAGKVLTKQELRNAVYSGSWVTDAKRYFSKNSRPKMGDDYLNGSANRQEYLETAIGWIAEPDLGGRKEPVDEYMAVHQHDSNANELWLYFQSVINWVKATFPKYRKQMKGVPWGTLYNKFGSRKYDHQKLETEISRLMQDDDVTNKKGIWEYVLTGEEKHLNIRAFTDSQKAAAYERSGGICAKCGGHFEFNEMEADHITPWHEGGTTATENCQMLCRNCNRRKGGK